ncbi:MAG: heavy-metal-associated domain-containing protein [Bacteroidales bacterium]|nr:heavy-metal-associated domain-containing protein [Bacteroidales bacterium]
MKKLILLLVMAVFTVGGINAQNSKVTAVSAKATSITIQTNASKNCQSCTDRFKENVPFFKGVKDYQYDAKTAKLTITYDAAKTNPDQIRKEISKMGYDADNVKADPAARAKLPACCRGGESCSHDAAKGAQGEHKCSHAEGAKSCNHQCQGAQGEHKCNHAEGAKSCNHQCQGAQGEHKCSHAEGAKSCNHQCQGAQGEHKCSHAEGAKSCNHQCQGAQGEHKCDHQCQGHK